MKIKYILHIISSTNDASGNVYNYFRLTDTRSGRQLCGTDAPESNVRYAIYLLNGKEYKPNFYFVGTELSKREYNRSASNIPYVGCSPEEIAAAFKKLLRSRKPKA